MVSISLCMITKNEEVFLEQCLNSISSLVDEIIVVDTGSLDKTKDIARKFTNKIYDFKWCDDFSTARNKSLEYATGDWILILDADEVLSENDFAEIRDIIQSADQNKVVGFSLQQRNYTNNQICAGWKSSRNESYKESKIASGYWEAPIIRLFKNISEVHYQGVVHESVYNSLFDLGSIERLEIPIHHYGHLDENKLARKGKNYEQMGQKKIEIEKDFSAYFELGRQLVANKKLDEAVIAFQESIRLKSDFFQSHFMLGSTYLLKNELDKSLSALRKAESINNEFPSLYNNLGIIYSKKKEYQEAMVYFRRSLDLNPTGAVAYKNIGLCYDKLGNKQKAYQAFEKAVELNPKYKNSIRIGNNKESPKHQNINTDEYWNRIWENESRDTWRIYPETNKRILESIGSNKEVLEVGCGVGILLKQIQSNKNVVTGIDISSFAVSVLNEDGMNGIQSVLPNIPLNDNSFDVVVGTEILEHLDNDKELLVQCHRVCKKGGRIIFVVPNDCLGPDEEPEHMHKYNQDEFKELLSSVSTDVTINGFVDQFTTDFRGKIINLSIPVLMGIITKE